MLSYRVYYKNYNLKKAELLGVLLERRKNLRGKTRYESGLRWARLTFGNVVRNKQAIFVVPKELKHGDDNIKAKSPLMMISEARLIE